MTRKTTNFTKNHLFSRTTNSEKSGEFSEPSSPPTKIVNPTLIHSERAGQSKGNGITADVAAGGTVLHKGGGNLAVVTSLPDLCPFQELVDEWLDNCRADGLSERTIADYEFVLTKFRWWWVELKGQPPHPKHLSTKDARAFAAFLREPIEKRWGVDDPRCKSHLSQASIATYGRTVKIFYAWLERENYIEQTPFNRSVKFSSHKHDRVVKEVSEESIGRLFAALEKDAESGAYHSLRNLSIISLLLDSGMRRGELLSLRLCDLDFKNDRCIIRGKTGQRYALFSEACKRVLVRYYRKWRGSQDDRPESPFWLTEQGEPLSYNGFGSFIRRLEQSSGVDFHAHKFRHTFASMMARQGTNVFDLKEMLGHSSINTTQIYVQGNIDHLSRVHQDHSPLAILNSKEGSRRNNGRPKRNPGRPRK